MIPVIIILVTILASGWLLPTFMFFLDNKFIARHFGFDGHVVSACFVFGFQITNFHHGFGVYNEFIARTLKRNGRGFPLPIFGIVPFLPHHYLTIDVAFNDASKNTRNISFAVVGGLLERTLIFHGNDVGHSAARSIGFCNGALGKSGAKNQRKEGGEKSCFHEMFSF